MTEEERWERAEFRSARAEDVSPFWKSTAKSLNFVSVTVTSVMQASTSTSVILKSLKSALRIKDDEAGWYEAVAVTVKDEVPAAEPKAANNMKKRKVRENFIVSRVGDRECRIMRKAMIRPRES